jgi:uncharacterized protein
MRGKRGAAIVSLVCAKREVQSLALRVPATYTTDIMGMTFEAIMAQKKQISQKISDINDTPAPRAISEFRGNRLVITSENDKIIPVTIPTQYLLEAKKAMCKEASVIKGATHNLSEQTWKDAFINEVVKWFIDTLLKIDLVSRNDMERMA